MLQFMLVTQLGWTYAGEQQGHTFKYAMQLILLKTKKQDQLIISVACSRQGRIVNQPVFPLQRGISHWAGQLLQALNPTP